MAGETSNITTHPNQEGLFPGCLVNSRSWSASYTSGTLEIGDIMGFGFVPDGATVFGIMMVATDMDTNVSPTLDQVIKLGSTTIVSSTTLGQAGGSAIYACAPTTTSGLTQITVTNTAGSATAASGTVTLTPLFVFQ